jgi:photosystem II stability/assembly factor-like uncharacterized protein
MRIPALLIAISAVAAQAAAADGQTDLLKGLEFRNIGPTVMGGRVDDFAVVESRPSTYYVGAASGGIWKTVNNGTTFEAVFDDQDTSSIGDLALAPSDPSILYVGTGEPNNRQSSSWGKGVYKTVDGGRTWTHLGLDDTHHIGRVVVHPTNPDIVYVAALGHLWGPNKDRGLYKTTDGGKTWTNTKFVNEDTGFVDVAMDPESPQTLYAASYQRRRTPFGYNGAGPGSGLWKTTDGGASWTKMTSGLPTEGDIGRIGIDVYRRDPRIVYALIEHSKQGGIYRSEDKGETWKKMSETNPRPSYYSQVRIDPSNDQRVWVLGAPMYYSEDGGKTFRTDLVQKIHGDYHAFWIDPADSNHVMAGTDGGIHVSYDRGRSWDYINTVPLAQFYEVDYDMQQPYRVCGGLQDNGSWCGPSRTLFTQGIASSEWFRIGGGDGFYAVVDKTDPNIVYTESQDGNIQRLDLRTNERRVIRPEPPAGERYRFNWNSPMLLSPHDPKTFYYGGNRLFISHDRGDTWSTVTPDLTNNASRDQMPIFGKTAKEFLSRNDGVVWFGTITTMSESPVKRGVLWVGTDDGNVQVSRDGGATWTNVSSRVPGVPKGTYVSRVEASRTGEGAAYLSFDGHRGNDFNVYVFRTDDFGQTWKSISGNLPKGYTVHVVREHPKSPSLLFAGTENGLWASLDRGGSWSRLRGKLPTVPVFDVQVHARDNDLIVATHGRSVFVLDDLSALTAPPATTAGEVQLFEIRPAAQYRLYGSGANTGHKAFLAPNPPEGALVTYRLGRKLDEKEEVKIEVKDSSGNLVRELKGPKEAGINRANWDLRFEPPLRPEPGEGGEGGGFFGPPRGPVVPPGTYTATVTVGSASASQPITVQEDARVRISEADRAAWQAAVRRGADLWRRAETANRTLTAVRKQLTELHEALKKSGKPDSVTNAVKATVDKADSLSRQLARQQALGFAGAPLEDEPDPLVARARSAYFAVGSMTAAPTEQQRRVQDEVARQVDSAVAGVNELVEKDLPALNRLLLDNGVGRIEVGKAIR